MCGIDTNQMLAKKYLLDKPKRLLLLLNNFNKRNRQIRNIAQIT